MRQVTRRTTQAFRGGDRLTVGNSRTDGLHYWLHGNLIARRAHNGGAPVEVSMCGWPTVTTRDRLNGIAGAFGYRIRFVQDDWTQYAYMPDTGARIAIDSSRWYNLDDLSARLMAQE